MEVFVREIMSRAGSFGIGFLMFLENIFPPIPSELIMPLAGYLSSRGDINVFIVIAAGTVGSLIGIIPWYFLGRKLGHQGARKFAAKHGRWLTMTPSDVDAAVRRFQRHGKISVLAGRLIPTVRTLISVPAGISNMPFGQFIILSAIGTFIWTSGLTMAGYLLGQAYGVVNDYIDPVATVVLICLVGFYIYRVATYRKEQQ